MSHSPGASPCHACAAPHRIDVHHHHAAPGFVAAIKAQNTGQHALIDWTPAQSVEEMDRAGVAKAITSVPPPGVWYGDDAAARALARECNDFAAKIARDYPGRFGIFAALPLPDIDGSLREIEYAFDVLKADGVGLMTSIDGRWLGDKAFAPVMDELNRRKAIVYTHPTAPACCHNLIAEVPDHLIEFATDTTRTMASLLLTGTAVRCADIKFIFSHAGGTMPYLTERLTWWEKVRADVKAAMPQGALHEFRKFYYDTAFSANPYALSCLTRLVSASQILFGSDFPFRTCSENVEGLAAKGISAEDLRANERDNARRLHDAIVVTR
jgi:predicted TIM-barrel fold metal-dependent hydrolase